MIEQINHIAGLWFSGALAMFWQVGILIILIGCVDLLIRKWAWPQLRYALWLMVLLKLILPPTISLSTSITAGLQPLAKQIVTKEANRENLNAITAMILTNLEAAATESSVEAVSFSDTVTEQQPALVVAGPDNPAEVSLKAATVKPTWQAYLMAVWLAGMFVLGGWLIIKLLHMRKEDLPQVSTASLPASFYESLTRCAERLGLRRVPKVVLTRRVACPAVFGVFRPVLLMPVGYISKMTRSDTEHMLLHELAHIKRGDLWVHGFYMLLQVVYWYNPLLWLVRGQMHHLRELCCDATVARILKERISEYRQTLIDVARRYLTKSTEPGLGLLGLFEDSNRLLVRLNWLKKETWRYQKMKKLTIITTIALMLAFVLPMAQAQDEPAAEASSAETVKVEEQASQSENTAEIQQKQKQYQQQLSQNMKKLEFRLQQLNIQKQKLEKELQAMAQARQAQVQAAQNKIKAKEAELKAKEVKEKSDKAKYKAAEAKASAEAHMDEAHAKQMKQWAKQMEAWAEQYKAHMNSPEVREHYKQLAQSHVHEWVNSEEFKQWQKAMDLWAKEQADMHEKAKLSDGAHTSAHESYPMPPMPPMPAEIAAPNVVVPATPTPPAPPAPVLSEPRTVAVAAPAETAGPALVLPDVSGTEGKSTRNIVIKKDKDGKYEATTEMHFVSKVRPGCPFIVRNSLGNIILKPSKDGTCDVRAVIRGKAETAAKAQQKIEQVSMNLESTDKRYYLKPVKPDDDQWKDLNVDLHIAVPPGISPDVQTNLGKIDIYNLQSNIKAITNMGAIKAVNTTGDVELLTKMGAIEFIAPKNLSAKFNIQNKMGSIDSELPLQVKKLDMFRTNAEGTIGSGQANIKMATDMGGIILKWQPSSQDEIKL